MANVSYMRIVADLAQAFESLGWHMPATRDGRMDADFMAWTQMWGDTSIGFGGIGGQGFTPATVVLCFRQEGGEAYVFVGGRYAYTVRTDDERADRFWTDVQLRRQVPGAADWTTSCKHQLMPNSNVCRFCDRGQPTTKLPMQRPEAQTVPPPQKTRRGRRTTPWDGTD